ncbi:MAG: hypothetical protein PHH54_02210 [Candidatus Nanoarchaeia archaeon]|nr:hypothetical protein [Candidatus Nanoarchaeia archaeon]MDD5740775.1 hypothetical protein [Candidatus Nanoarchaeia archaeon]
MKKDNQIYIYIVIIILVIIAVIFYIKNNNDNNNGGVNEKLAKCLGEKSELYVQLGCKFCKDQEDIFGNNTQYLNIIDCHFETQKCVDAQITGTPTWIINGEKYPGVQSIEKLKQLTGC